MNAKLRLRIRYPDGEEKTFAFQKREMILGQSKTCDVTVKDPELSNRHVQFTMISPDNITLIKLSNDTEVYLNGQSITDEMKAIPGSTFKMGNTFVTLESIGDENLKGFKFPGEERSKLEVIDEEMIKTRAGDIDYLLLMMKDVYSGQTGSMQSEKLLSRIAGIFNAENGVILQKENDRRQVLAARIIRGTKLFYPVNILDEIIKGTTSAFLDFSPKDLKALSRKTGIGSAICASIHDGEKSWGGIFLDRGANRKRFQKIDLALLCRLGNLLGMIFLREHERNRVASERDGLRTEREKWSGFTKEDNELQVKSRNQKYQQLLFKALRVASTDNPVFLHGETGTGRFILAQRIHLASSRKDQPLVRVDCNAIPRQILEQEIFGFENPDDDPLQPTIRGYLEQANGGTLYLQEISVLPESVQAGISETMKTGMMTRVRGRAGFAINVRLIVSTDVEISSLLRSEKIHPELHESLKLSILKIPALKQRVEDIVPLARFFLRMHMPKNRTVPEFAKEVVELLNRYTWPANIRELTHCMRYIAAVCADHRIELGDLPRSILEQPVSTTQDDLSFRDQMDRFEALLIREALEENNYIVTRAARALGLSESTLRYRMQRLDIVQAV